MSVRAMIMHLSELPGDAEIRFSPKWYPDTPPTFLYLDPTSNLEMKDKDGNDTIDPSECRSLEITPPSTYEDLPFMKRPDDE